MNFTAVEFSRDELSTEVTGMQSVTIDEEALYKYLVFYIAKNLVGKGSHLGATVMAKKAHPSELSYRHVDGRVALMLGTGEFKFHTYDGDEMIALHHYVGKPVGTDCGVQVLKRLVLFSAGPIERLTSFLNKAVENMEATQDDCVRVYCWHIRYNYWDEEAKMNKRPLSSVVLPQSLKERITSDIARFLNPKTKVFYETRGVPFRRSYLFYGAPGTGKTSLVQALAAHFDRNVCYLMPTHPDFTDDGLRQAINKIPENSIVVFEDIDALFDKQRQSRVKESKVTFSGLLNVLDGIGSTNGQIFILTTNLRENLDHALIRNGRVDLHFEFTYAVPEQFDLMWRNFYPDHQEHAEEFARRVAALLEEHKLQVTTAGLQHYFVTQMEATAEEALERIGQIVEDIKQNSSKSMLAAATVGQGKKKNNNKKKQGKKAKKDTEEEEDEEESEEEEVVEATPAAAAAAGDGKKKKKQQKKKTEKAADGNADTASAPTKAAAPVAVETEEEKAARLAKEEERKERQRRKNERRNWLSLKDFLKLSEEEKARIVAERKARGKQAAEAKSGETDSAPVTPTESNGAATNGHKQGEETPTAGDGVKPLPKREKKNRRKSGEGATAQQDQGSAEAKDKDAAATDVEGN